MKAIIVIFIPFFSFTSCVLRTGDAFEKKEEASTVKNNVGQLFSKEPTGFDTKFGYKIVVYSDTQIDGEKKEAVSLFVSKQTYDRIPEPKDSIKVYIEYIRDVKYGDGWQGLGKVLIPLSVKNFNIYAGHFTEQ